MTETDKTTLASIAALLVADRISVAKALEGAYLLGEMAGKVEMARITEGKLKEVLSHPSFDSALELMSGKLRP